MPNSRVLKTWAADIEATDLESLRELKTLVEKKLEMLEAERQKEDGVARGGTKTPNQGSCEESTSEVSSSGEIGEHSNEGHQSYEDGEVSSLGESGEHNNKEHQSYKDSEFSSSRESDEYSDEQHHSDRESGDHSNKEHQSYEDSEFSSSGESGEHSNEEHQSYEDSEFSGSRESGGYSDEEHQSYEDSEFSVSGESGGYSDEQQHSDEDSEGFDDEYIHAWNKARSWRDLVKLNRKFILDSALGHKVSAPYHAGPLDKKDRELFKPLLKLHDFGILTTGSQPAARVVKIMEDGTLFERRQIPYVGFFVRYIKRTEAFLNALSSDRRLLVSAIDYRQSPPAFWPGSHAGRVSVIRDRRGSGESLDKAIWTNRYSLEAEAMFSDLANIPAASKVHLVYCSVTQRNAVDLFKMKSGQFLRRVLDVDVLEIVRHYAALELKMWDFSTPISLPIDYYNHGVSRVRRATPSTNEPLS